MFSTSKGQIGFLLESTDITCLWVKRIRIVTKKSMHSYTQEITDPSKISASTTRYTCVIIYCMCKK